MLVGSIPIVTREAIVNPRVVKEEETLCFIALLTPNPLLVLKILQLETAIR